jgi:TatD DNase family protein
MKLFDTHCHLDLYPDYRQVIEETERAEIETIFVTNTPSVFRQAVKLAHGCRFIHPAIGLHPELAHERQRELNILTSQLGETRFVGEIGLDFTTPDREVRTTQRRVLSTILDHCARLGDKVLTVHSRRAADEVVEMIGPGYAGTIILHWYSGSLSTLQQGVANGFYFSINPAMLTSAKGRAIIAALPQHRVLAETDGPFVQVGGNNARPSHSAHVVSGIAQLWQVDAEHAAMQLRQNFDDVLRA